MIMEKKKPTKPLFLKMLDSRIFLLSIASKCVDNGRGPEGMKFALIAEEIGQFASDIKQTADERIFFKSETKRLQEELDYCRKQRDRALLRLEAAQILLEEYQLSQEFDKEIEKGL